ncbi:hypothetical protein AB0D11_31045 [Streptomyces monashensis]|uniref:WD40 repeat domain-containing protein n=1 Tax=Streptomyces monashensis TaxID=1678012 RepID=UPI0033FDE2DB
MTALAARPLPTEGFPIRQALPHPRPHRPSPRARWLPGLLTGVLVVLTCLTAAAVQSVLPPPWRNGTPEHESALRPERWRLVGNGRLGPSGRADAIAFTADGPLLLAVSGPSVDTWDLTEPEHPERVVLGHGTAGVTAIGVSPDGQTLVTAGARGVRAQAVGSGLTQWSYAAGKQVKALLATRQGVLLADSLPNGSTTLAELRLGHGRPLPPMTLHSLDGRTRSAQFSPDGRTLALADTTGSVRLWNLAHPGRALLDASFAASSDGNGPTALAFSPDGRLLAIVDAERTVHLWDVSDTAHPHSAGRPLAGAERVTALAFSPDNRMVATVGTDRTANLWWRMPAAASGTGG